MKLINYEKNAYDSKLDALHNDEDIKYNLRPFFKCRPCRIHIHSKRRCFFFISSIGFLKNYLYKGAWTWILVYQSHVHVFNAISGDREKKIQISLTFNPIQEKWSLALRAHHYSTLNQASIATILYLSIRILYLKKHRLRITNFIDALVLNADDLVTDHFAFNDLKQKKNHWNGEIAINSNLQKWPLPFKIFSF